MNTKQVKLEPKRITINQYLVDFAFEFKVVNVWPTPNGPKYLWLENVSPAMYQIMNLMSMWGGPTQQEHVDGMLRQAWEIHEDHVEWFREFIMKTARYRNGSDTAQL